MIPRTVLSFWKNQEARGEKMRAVWLVISMGKIQPEGYIVGWSINKRHAQKAAQDYALRTRDIASFLRLVPT